MKATDRNWAPAIKVSLGDVWHHVRYGGSAHCDHRVRLSMDYAKAEPPADAYVCRRCKAITGASVVAPSQHGGQG